MRRFIKLLKWAVSSSKKRTERLMSMADKPCDPSNMFGPGMKRKTFIREMWNYFEVPQDQRKWPNDKKKYCNKIIQTFLGDDWYVGDPIDGSQLRLRAAIAIENSHFGGEPWTVNDI